MEDLGALAAMFGTAFGAATVLPFQSEIVFATLQLRSDIALVVLIVVASAGNTLGSVVNYGMGLGIEHFRDRRWFPVTQDQLDRAQRWYARYGVWTLLLSWAPLGDAITIVAGIMRTNFVLFLGLVAVAKTGRYIAFAWLTARALGG